MIKNIHYLSTFALAILLFMSGSKTIGQAITKPVQVLQQQFELGMASQFQEKIYLDTDRRAYLTGETIWIKAYSVDASFHMLSNISKVLNVELIAADGSAVKQLRIQLDHGLGAGQLFVTPEMVSGQYTLRAYTNWMRNFESGFIFAQDINIINPLVVPDDQATDVAESKEIHVDLFPEGGQLVQGLESKVGVKITNSEGKGVLVEGVVLDEEEVEITRFATTEGGYASFQLIPVADKEYFVRLTDNHSDLRFQLPEINEFGLVMSVEETVRDEFEVSFQSTLGFPATAYLVVHSRGEIKKIEQIDITENAQLTIPKTNLATGISHITILNEEFTPIVERLVFKFPEQESLLSLDIADKEYSKRNKVQLSLKVLGQQSNESVTNLSVSVFKAPESFLVQDNIVTEFLLTSDLKGSIPNAWHYLNPANKSRGEDIDLIMITNGWRRFSWGKILDNDVFVPKFLPEQNAPIISGQLLEDAFGTLPKTLQMTFMGRSSILNSIELDKNLNFNFEIPFRIKRDKGYFFIEEDTLGEEQIMFESPFYATGTLKSQATRKRKLKEDMKPYLNGLYTNIQLSQVYRDINKINGLEEENSTVYTPFYGTPDKVYRLDEYTRFETMADLFLEYISSIYIRKRDNEKWFYVTADYSEAGEALVLMDGLPIRNFDDVMALDPLQIEKIDIINDSYFVGSLSFTGIINFVTYKGNFGQQDVPDYLVASAYSAIQTEREFYHPNYDVDNAALERIPDYRNTLYWNPNVVLKGNDKVDLSFYSADDIGHYVIEVNGVTSTGTPISGSGSFQVLE